MAQLAWATDIHLDWLRERPKRDEFYRSVRETGADAVLLTGDIAMGIDVVERLGEMHQAVGRTIYFVLGNHDYYGGSIRKVRQAITRLTADCPGLVYLPAAGAVRLTGRTVLVGHDGWGDARLGAYATSGVFLTDFVAIEELQAVQADRRALRRELERLGDEAAWHLTAVLPEALAKYSRVVVATHVPPFREAAWYDGRISDDDFLPFFACEAAGRVLRTVMQSRPDHEMLVLCGHTHGQGEVEMLPNLRVLTGGAQYGRPQVNRVLTFD